ncbi:MAG: 6-phosphogluconolactonase [Actinomycetota bacterium]
MTFTTKVFPSERYAAEAAAQVASLITAGGSLVLTGGGAAAAIYPEIDADLSGLDIFFSDERCVPPDDAASNFAMANRLLLERGGAVNVHRMRGEDPPRDAARSYHDELVPVVERGFDLMLLGMGEDNHIAALFPNSPALMDSSSLCLPVDRPDGLKGLTITPPAIAKARSVLLVVTGEAKADAVARAVDGDDDHLRYPVQLLAGHPDATFLLDEAAASRL